jgi:hypothetical protein
MERLPHFVTTYQLFSMTCARRCVIRQLFEWYATGNHSLLDVARKADIEGLTYRKTGNKVGKSTVHKILTSPIYHGDFDWAGKRYHGKHKPIITQELFDRVQKF